MKKPAIAVISILIGCQPLDVSTYVAAEQNCPDGDCPPPPDDPPDDPPPEDPPTPPDPAKRREQLISLDYVSLQLVALYGTTIQLSHLGGEDLEFHNVQQVCETTPRPDAEECREACMELDLPRARTQCLQSCSQTTTTCSNVCSAWETRSWLRWGAGALQASGHTSCNMTTCPACAPATEVPSLRDRPLPVPAFDKSYTVGPLTYAFYCRVNQWTFTIDNHLTVASSAAGLAITIPGDTGDPAVVCDNAPDVAVDNLKAQLTFRFPTTGMGIGADATLLGDWHLLGPVFDFLADLRTAVETRSREAAHDALNTVDARAAYRSLFTKIVDRYVSDVTHERLDNLLNVSAEAGGLRVRYYVK